MSDTSNADANNEPTFDIDPNIIEGETGLPTFIELNRINAKNFELIYGFRKGFEHTLELQHRVKNPKNTKLSVEHMYESLDTVASIKEEHPNRFTVFNIYFDKLANLGGNPFALRSNIGKSLGGFERINVIGAGGVVSFVARSIGKVTGLPIQTPKSMSVIYGIKSEG